MQCKIKFERLDRKQQILNPSALDKLSEEVAYLFVHTTQTSQKRGIFTDCSTNAILVQTLSASSFIR